ncbi:MAG: 6,7-dimethyl-8-ribityllumazine synthase [Spirochaetes bacterium GWB1_36_13]|nr:MAG: 6,7-dimethyl-8-ribityllumazine synthase [Spirochaetes bacterium GWB1_36_13]
MKKIEGQLSGKGLKIGIISSRFNSFIVEQLVQGSLDCLMRHEVDEKDIVLIKVPGAFEIPSALAVLIENHQENLDAVICLGAVIRGSTPHFDFVASEVSKGVAQIAIKSPIPVSFGVLTTDTIEQAVERAGTKAGNKGFDAAMTVLEMANLYKQLKK